MELTQPMLAVAAKDLSAIRFPVLASYKIDGVRAVMRKGELLSRKMLAIPNLFTQSRFQHPYLEGLDGELAVGNPFDKNLMQQTMSGVMSRDGEPEVTWYVFDKWNTSFHYGIRAAEAKRTVEQFGSPHVKWLSQKVIKDLPALQAYEEEAVNLGYEGLIIRDPLSPYKQGRSTLKQGYMLKIKRFEDSEAEIIGVKELMHNDNEATIDERGYTKRSTHQDNKRAAGMLGAFVVRDIRTKIEFDVGTGFTREQRINLWEGRQYLAGKVIKYRHFPIGVVDKPRFPTFVGFRDRRDMS